MNKNKVFQNAKVLWDYHNINFELETADFILAMGSHDLRVAEHAADLFLKGLAPLLITSGGLGKITGDEWTITEGEAFANVALEKGVSEDSIMIEKASKNSGDNLLFSRALLERNRVPVSTGILVTKPYMKRRAFATASKQWPKVSWKVSAPPVSFEEYPTPDTPGDKMINLMVGDLQRIEVYAHRGFQVPQEIPADVWASYEFLKDAGYDKFVIPT